MPHPDSGLTTLAFCGYGRHGKDEAAYALHRQTYLHYDGSLSWAALPYMAERLGMPMQMAWERRHDNRELWRKCLDELRADDPTKLVRMSLEGATIVVGIRAKAELVSVREAGLIDHFVWVDRPGFGVDPTVEYGPEDCDCVLGNTGSLEDLDSSVRRLALELRLPLRESRSAATIS